MVSLGDSSVAPSGTAEGPPPARPRLPENRDIFTESGERKTETTFFPKGVTPSGTVHDVNPGFENLKLRVWMVNLRHT